MKKYLFVGGFFFLIIGLVLFGWSIKSSAIVEENYNINPDFSNIPNIPDIRKCVIYDELLGSDFILNYPKMIIFHNSGKLSLTINKPINGKVINKNNVSKMCGLSIEVWIDIENIILEPGARSFQPFLDSQAQSFFFNIKPLNNRPVKGTVWIFANIFDENNNSMERIPLFAIPLAIQIKSLLGLSPNTLRNFSLFLLSISIFSLIGFSKLKNIGDDIILFHKSKIKR